MPTPRIENWLLQLLRNTARKRRDQIPTHHPIDNIDISGRLFFHVRLYSECVLVIKSGIET